MTGQDAYQAGKILGILLTYMVNLLGARDIQPVRGIPGAICLCRMEQDQVPFLPCLADILFKFRKFRLIIYIGEDDDLIGLAHAARSCAV